MTVAAENGQMSLSAAYAPLEGRFEVIKEIGDGSFGNVVLARVRAAGSSVARRGTMVGFPSSRIVMR
jgi:meiosis induction protein kinase IME2/SME1